MPITNWRNVLGIKPSLRLPEAAFRSREAAHRRVNDARQHCPGDWRWRSAGFGQLFCTENSGNYLLSAFVARDFLRNVLRGGGDRPLLLGGDPLGGGAVVRKPAFLYLNTAHHTVESYRDRPAVAAEIETVLSSTPRGSEFVSIRFDMRVATATGFVASQYRSVPRRVTSALDQGVSRSARSSRCGESPKAVHVGGAICPSNSARSATKWFVLTR